MKITRQRLEEILKEEIADMAESYTPVPDSKLDNPESAIIHIDNELPGMDDDIDSLLGELDVVDARFEKLKHVLTAMLQRIKAIEAR